MADAQNFEPARACLEVVAGIIPNQPIPEYTKRFWITSREWEANPTQSHLIRRWVEADHYAKSLLNPNQVNWVQLSWVWF